MLRASLFLFCLALPVSASAAPFEMKLFGHDVSVAGDAPDALTVDGKTVLSEQYITLGEMLVVADVPILVGTASPGGNACEGSTFVLSFPPDGEPRLDGPLDTCSATTHSVEDGALAFETEAFPGTDAQHWAWDAAEGFQAEASTPFAADEAKGWDDIRKHKAGHPLDLMGYGPVAREIDTLLGSDKSDVLPIMSGPGTGEYQGGLYVGQSCTAHMCGEESLLIVASASDETVFIAWKPSGRKIVVRPAVKTWPDAAKAQLKKWAADWK